MSYVEIQSNYIHDSRKIILSEEVFARLQGLINATAFNNAIIDKNKYIWVHAITG